MTRPAARPQAPPRWAPADLPPLEPAPDWEDRKAAWAEAWAQAEEAKSAEGR